jgi:hypothetical protein
MLSCYGLAFAHLLQTYSNRQYTWVQYCGADCAGTRPLWSWVCCFCSKIAEAEAAVSVNEKKWSCVCCNGVQQQPRRHASHCCPPSPLLCCSCQRCCCRQWCFCCCSPHQVAVSTEAEAAFKAEWQKHTLRHSQQSPRDTSRCTGSVNAQ